MTDEHLDRLIRDADPHRPGLTARLDGAEQALLEEIVSNPVPRRSPRRLMVAAAAAAVLTVLAGVGLAQRDDRPAAPTAQPTVSAPAVLDSAAILRVAETSPRLLVDEKGWTITDVYGFAEREGSIRFAGGPSSLEMTWTPAAHYDGFYRDRLRVSAPEKTTVDGWAGALFRYNDSDFAVMLQPRDDVFVELRTSGPWTRASFDRILTRIVRVDPREWLAAMPAEIVTPGKADEAAAKILADVPLPPGFDRSALPGLGTNDPYQFGARVTGLVGCAWIAEWQRADRAGDDQAKSRAATALSSSHRWKVLHDMNDEGDWPEAFWRLADQVAAGDLPKGYADSIGCR